MSLPPGQSLSWLDMAVVVALVVWESPPPLLLYTWKDRLEKAQQEQSRQRIQVRDFYLREHDPVVHL